MDYDSHLEERKSLLSGLLEAVKQCQIRFGGRTELATDNDGRVICLCNRLESVLNHGIKVNNKGLMAIRQVTEKVTGLNLRNSFDSDVEFWHFVKEFLNKHEYERYLLLRNISTDSGRGRSWLRSSLNERSLEKYMHMILADASFIRQNYEDWAFLLDQERSSMLPMMSAGLGSILFAINIDDGNLNSPLRTNTPLIGSAPVEVTPTLPEPMPVISSRESTGPKKKEKRKKLRGTDNIVSFDNDENDVADSESNSFEIGSYASSVSSSSKADPLEKIDLYSETKNDIPSQESKNVEVPEAAENAELKSEHYEVPRSNQDDLISDARTGVGLTSEKPSISSSERIVPTNLPNFSNDVDFSRIASSCSVSSMSSTDTPINHSEETTITTLTPVTDTSVELILVSDDEQQSQSEDSLSIPSFTEDTDHAARALAFTQKALFSSCASADSNKFLNDRNPSFNDSRLRNESFSKLSRDELDQFVYSVLHKQDELNEKNRSLRHLLDQEMEMSSSLRIKVDEFEKANSSKTEKENSQISALSRENDVLKHQLKKYVGAVQMLKRDTVQAHEVLSSSSDSQPILPNPSLEHINHASEALEYEKKLIQVAEMHGELMEFNEHLHRTVVVKENIIKRLRNELIDLRGPLPENDHLSDEDVLSDNSDDTSSLSLSTRALINIWIPSAFLTGRANDSHHVYQVFVRIKDIEWNIYRRYSHFNKLHQNLRKKYKIINTFNFPPKKAIGNRDAKLVEDRRQKLQHYLRCVVNFIVKNTDELANSPNKETLMNLLPFFGDISPEARKNKYGKNKSTGSQRNPSSKNSDQNLYTGL